ncbi:uncharacterized protein V6R79_021242 [Siganus canaliculatus]
MQPGSGLHQIKCTLQDPAGFQAVVFSTPQFEATINDHPDSELVVNTPQTLAEDRQDQDLDPVPLRASEACSSAPEAPRRSTLAGRNEEMSVNYTRRGPTRKRFQLPPRIDITASAASAASLQQTQFFPLLSFGAPEASFSNRRCRCDVMSFDGLWPQTPADPGSFCFPSSSCFHLSCSEPPPPAPRLSRVASPSSSSSAVMKPGSVSSRPINEQNAHVQRNHSAAATMRRDKDSDWSRIRPAVLAVGELMRSDTWSRRVETRRSSDEAASSSEFRGNQTCDTSSSPQRDEFKP